MTALSTVLEAKLLAFLLDVNSPMAFAEQHIETPGRERTTLRVGTNRTYSDIQCALLTEAQRGLRNTGGPLERRAYGMSIAAAMERKELHRIKDLLSPALHFAEPSSCAGCRTTSQPQKR